MRLGVREELARRGVRICWETNGMMHPNFLDLGVRYSLETGGLIKFDLRAFDEGLHRTLTGVSNRQTVDHVTRAARRFRERPGSPLVVASTLLVPRHVEADEVGRIARFLADLDPRIPHVLFAFARNFYLDDRPCTSVRHAQKAEAAARAAGRFNVHIGNRHLLGRGWG